MERYRVLSLQMKAVHALLAITTIFACSACLAQGHIEANVPEGQHFDTYLQRDLDLYFAANAEQGVTVEYELLRKTATQVGVAYPKFYAWVKVFKKKVLEQQGAVRIAAIEQEGFQITDYVPAEKIRSEPKSIETVFPAALCPKILELAKP